MIKVGFGSFCANHFWPFRFIRGVKTIKVSTSRKGCSIAFGGQGDGIIGAFLLVHVDEGIRNGHFICAIFAGGQFGAIGNYVVGELRAA